MLQIATFELPKEQAEANEFLKSHKPNGTISYNDNFVFIGYEDGEYPVEYQIADLQELSQGVKAARFQQEVAQHVLEYERADEKVGSQKWVELDSALRDLKRKMDIQDVKAAFVEKRIAELKNSNGNGCTGADAEKASE